MKNTGNERLAGTHAEVWFDGHKALDLVSIKATVKANREKVPIGIDEDSKMTSLAGEYSAKITRVYTHFAEYVEKFKNRQDPRLQIVTALKDPDALGGQEERYAINDAWIDDLDVINYEKGKLVDQELKGGFPPSRMVLLDSIREV